MLTLYKTILLGLFLVSKFSSRFVNSLINSSKARVYMAWVKLKYRSIQYFYLFGILIKKQQLYMKRINTELKFNLSFISAGLRVYLELDLNFKF